MLRQRLFCARDHLGCHPLVYFSSERLFALASMPKALPEVPRELDENEVISRLRLAGLQEISPRESHIFVGLRTLPAGHCLTVSSSDESSKRYWALDPERRLHLSDADTLGTFRALFEEAVRCRLRGLGEVGGSRQLRCHGHRRRAACSQRTWNDGLHCGAQVRLYMRRCRRMATGRILSRRTNRRAPFQHHTCRDTARRDHTARRSQAYSSACGPRSHQSVQCGLESADLLRC
jgi:hypothetical protein